VNIPSKVGIGASRSRLFREAEISDEVTAILRRLLGSEADPILVELFRDDVRSFAKRFELDPESDIAISGFCIEPLVAAVLCRARGIADENHGKCGSTTRVSAAKAAVLNEDMLLFRRVTEQMPEADLAKVSDIAAKMGRHAFVSKGLLRKYPAAVIDATGGRSLSEVWLEDEFLPAFNAKNVLVQNELLIVDKSCLGGRNSVDKKVISDCLGSRTSNCIKQIWAFGGLKVWKGDDGWRGRSWGELGPWSEVKIVDFSRSSLTSIGEGSFMRSKKLVKLVLPDTVTEIRQGAFLTCDSLRTV
jgi:hypothetical protein